MNTHVDDAMQSEGSPSPDEVMQAVWDATGDPGDGAPAYRVPPELA
jgi:hypothetical protein